MTGLAYKQSSVDSSVYQLNSVVIVSLNYAIPYALESPSFHASFQVP
jgi:hypothetical protein